MSNVPDPSRDPRTNVPARQALISEFMEQPIPEAWVKPFLDDPLIADKHERIINFKEIMAKLVHIERIISPYAQALNEALLQQAEQRLSQAGGDPDAPQLLDVGEVSAVITLRQSAQWLKQQNGAGWALLHQDTMRDTASDYGNVLHNCAHAAEVMRSAMAKAEQRLDKKHQSKLKEVFSDYCQAAHEKHFAEKIAAPIADISANLYRNIYSLNPDAVDAIALDQGAQLADGRTLLPSAEMYAKNCTFVDNTLLKQAPAMLESACLALNNLAQAYEAQILPQLQGRHGHEGRPGR